MLLLSGPQLASASKKKPRKKAANAASYHQPGWGNPFLHHSNPQMEIRVAKPGSGKYSVFRTVKSQEPLFRLAAWGGGSPLSARTSNEPVSARVAFALDALGVPAIVASFNRRMDSKAFAGSKAPLVAMGHCAGIRNASGLLEGRGKIVDGKVNNRAVMCLGVGTGSYRPNSQSLFVPEFQSEPSKQKGEVFLKHGDHSMRVRSPAGPGDSQQKAKWDASKQTFEGAKYVAARLVQQLVKNKHITLPNDTLQVVKATIRAYEKKIKNK